MPLFRVVVRRPNAQFGRELVLRADSAAAIREGDPEAFELVAQRPLLIWGSGWEVMGVDPLDENESPGMTALQRIRAGGWGETAATRHRWVAASQVYEVVEKASDWASLVAGLAQLCGWRQS